jgi:hypothetical protein
MKKILYIAGFERSGSTLIHNLIGQIKGYTAVGELRHLKKRHYDKGRCGCGEVFEECDFWRANLESLDWRGKDGDYVKERQLPLFLIPILGEKLLSYPATRSQFLRKLYTNVWDNSGAEVIVDSSKALTYLKELNLIDGFEVRVFHVVRDPRAVCYSLLKRKRSGHPGYLKFSPIRFSIKWIMVNFLFWSLSVFFKERYVCKRYEDFVDKPEEFLENICSWCATSSDFSGIVEDSNVKLAPNHSAGGSPSRFATGEVELKEDLEWLVDKDNIEMKLVGLICAPMLRVFGYYE